jgi:hypothetical protein
VLCIVLLQVLQTMVLSGNAHCPSMEYISYIKNFQLNPMYHSVSIDTGLGVVCLLCARVCLMLSEVNSAGCMGYFVQWTTQLLCSACRFEPVVTQATEKWAS